MTAYEWMIQTNHRLIEGDTLNDAHKRNIVLQLMSSRSTLEQAERFYIGVKFPGNTDAAGRQMYPAFFIPPYNDGKKYKTILNQTPKTHILSANMYELEILRLLYLFAQDDPEVQRMVGKTLARLKTTCYSSEDDGVGECFDTALVVLRFLAASAPGETVWMQDRMDNYRRHIDDKKRPWYIKWYYWLCLTEMPFDIAKPEIDLYKAEMLHWLTSKSCVMNSEQDKILHPMLLCIIRNALARYPEYAYIKDRQPYVSGKDGRLYFDMGLYHGKI
ncbi:MAG: hypothetical protein VB111_06295 [Clostridiaceae bacterium]|nr:hypothetical protein [Clostridiaceae bacterium]